MSEGGVLRLVKPPGCSSHDVVAMARRRVGLGAGHLGTLDPLASGVLAVAYGSATRFIRYAGDWDKEYVAEIWLGRESPTDDFAQPLVFAGDASKIASEDVARALSALQGTHEQIPPVFSARQVGGRRAYRAARAGEPLALAARPATLHAFRLFRFFAGDVARVRLSLHVGAGYYVRSLARDLGRTLGVGGVLAALVRTRSGSVHVEECDALEEEWRPLPPSALVAHLPAIPLSQEEAWRISHGQRLPGATALGPHRAEREGDLVAIVVGREDGVWHPQTVLGLED